MPVTVTVPEWTHNPTTDSSSPILSRGLQTRKTAHNIPIQAQNGMIGMAQMQAQTIYNKGFT